MTQESKVLIVWEEAQAVPVENCLKREGFTTTLSGTDDEALVVLSTEAYDVVLTEHRPPDIDSYKILNYVTSNNPGTPVIVLVPLGEKDIISFLRKRAFDVIRKTPDLTFTEKLPYCVEKALNEKRLKEGKRKAEERLMRERIISEATIQSVVNGVVFINSQGVIEKINHKFETFLGKGVVTLGRNISELPGENPVKRIFLKPLETGACWETKQCGKDSCPAYGRKDTLCWFIETACAICNDDTVVDTSRLRFLMQCEIYRRAHEKYYSEPLEFEYNGRFLYVYRRNVVDETGILLGEILDFIDMTSERNYREQLRRLSITDALTGLHNRRYITERMEEEFLVSRRYHRDMSIMLIDIDNFKQINDSYGHPAGDEVLRQLAELFEREGRKSDVVGRYGGEEFMILMPNTGKQEAAVVAERLRKIIQEYRFGVLPPSQSLTVSIGVSSLSGDTKSMDELLKTADDALYQAKAEGKDRVVVR